MLGARPASETGLIAPQAVVHWSVGSGQSKDHSAIVGRDVVAADGTLRVGPYGPVKVAGLTPDQARRAVEQHVAAKVAEPRVTVQVEGLAKGERSFFSRGNDAGWQYGKQARPPASTKATPSSPALPSISSAPPAKPGNQVAAKPSGRAVDPRIRPVSATEPEVAPAPNVLAMPSQEAHAADGSSGVRPIPRELSILSLPSYVIDPPDILLVESTQGLKDQPIRGQHLVRPDGTVGLGIYGSVHVAGRTLEQARALIAQQLATRIKDFDPANLNVDVLAYNSKVYYVITDGGGYGEQVIRVPVTGYETVLDAIGQINGLPAVSSKKHIWVARRSPGHGGGGQQVLPVDWVGITQKGSTATNYQVLPGDRIYVHSDRLIRMDNGLAKMLNPIERLLGVTLLGSTVVNSINGNRTGSGSGFGGFP